MCIIHHLKKMLTRKIMACFVAQIDTLASILITIYYNVNIFCIAELMINEIYSSKKH